MPMECRPAPEPLTGDQCEVAQRHLYLCDRAARSFARRYRHVEWGEFYSAAFDGLVLAIRGYDEARGRPLECYATPYVEGECRALARRSFDGPVRLPRAAGLATHRACPITEAWSIPSPVPAPEAALEAREDFDWLLFGLPVRWRAILAAIYGPEEWTGAEVADRLGVTRNRIYQIQDQALARVAERARYRRTAS